jgi:hypothetical protein
MRYRNVSGQDRVLMVERASGVKVAAGDVIDVTEPGPVEGLRGQEAVWQPVTEPDDNEAAEE